MLILAIALVGLSLYVGAQVVGVLYGIVFPPNAPLPDGSVQLEHENLAYGVDNWLYGTTEDACRVARFYVAADGICRIAPNICENSRVDEDETLGSGDNIARCSGTTQFSIFEMSWNVDVAAGYTDEYPTRFRLEREVYWIGNAPRQTAITETE